MNLLLLLGVVCGAAVSVDDSSSPPPDIVFFLADDLGYNEMGFMNETRSLHTPNLDALAKGGVVLKNYYVQAICSPSRSALMSGRYPMRLGTQSNVIFWDTPWGVPLENKFLSSYLSDAGYSTALFGKCGTRSFNHVGVLLLMCAQILSLGGILACSKKNTPRGNAVLMNTWDICRGVGRAGHTSLLVVRRLPTIPPMTRVLCASQHQRRSTTVDMTGSAMGNQTKPATGPTQRSSYVLAL